MNFEPTLRLQIETELIRQFDHLLDSSVEFISDHFHDFHRVAFENMMPKVPPYKLDQESCIGFLLSSKDDITNTKFLFREPGYNGWGRNEVRFPFIGRFPPITEWGTPQFWNYRAWRDNLEYACEDEFWKMDHVYQSCRFSTCEIFDNKTLKEDELSAFRQPLHFKYLKENWLTFIHELVEYSFPQFRYSERFSTKKVRRYLQELTGDIWFGFEYEVSEVLHDLRTGTPSLPDQFNLILINAQFDKKADVERYYFCETKGLVSLGILGNPFFYQPCYMLSGFCAVDMHRKAEAGTPYLTEIVQTDTGEYKLLHPEAFAERMKKHAFFYMSLLASTSKSYLDYVQSVVSAAIVRA